MRVWEHVAPATLFTPPTTCDCSVKQSGFGMSENTRASFARSGRVRTLYDDVIARVIDGLREDAQADGIDDILLAQLKQVLLAPNRWIPCRVAPQYTHPA